MSWKLTLPLYFCFFALIATSCGKDDDDNDTTPPTFEEFEKQAPKAIAEFMCNGAFTCPEKQPPNIMLVAGRFADKTDCIANLPGLLWGEGGLYVSDRQAIQAGRLEFDAAKAAKCMTDIKNEMKQCQSIDVLSTPPLSDCEIVFIPKVEANAPCGSDHECISNNCAHNNGDECFGRCAEAIESSKEGENCGKNGCAAGLYCVSKSESDSARICVKPGSRQKGERCDGTQVVCAGDMTCTLQNVCDDRTPLAASGESCDILNTACKPGMACVDLEVNTASQSLSGTCGAPKAAGEPCIMEFECQINHYCSGEFPDSGECVALKTLDQPCQDSQECLDALYCDSGTGKCADPNSDDACKIPTE